jgi:hypothetical protein
MSPTSAPDLDITVSWEDDDPSASGARRLGSRAPTRFSVFVKQGAERYRARAAELSTTGVVLDLRHTEGLDVERLQQLELAVPGARRPIHVVARPVRKIGRLLAYEFLTIREVDRLTLAEHLDRLERGL